MIVWIFSVLSYQHVSFDHIEGSGRNCYHQTWILKGNRCLRIFRLCLPFSSWLRFVFVETGKRFTQYWLVMHLFSFFTESILSSLQVLPGLSSTLVCGWCPARLLRVSPILFGPCRGGGKGFRLFKVWVYLWKLLWSALGNMSVLEMPEWVQDARGV